MDPLIEKGTALITGSGSGKSSDRQKRVRVKMYDGQAGADNDG